MHQIHNPSAVHPPGPSYSHAILSESRGRVLHVSGQVGVDGTGRHGSGATEQADIVFANLAAILSEANMTPANLTQLRAYLVRREDLAAFREARDRFLGGVKPATTLVFVSGLGHPDWLMEVEASAAA